MSDIYSILNPANQEQYKIPLYDNITVTNVMTGSYGIRANTFCAFDINGRLSPFTVVDPKTEELLILYDPKNTLFPKDCCIYFYWNDTSHTSGGESLGIQNLMPSFHAADLRNDGVGIEGTSSLTAASFNPVDGTNTYTTSHRVFMKVVVTNDTGQWCPANGTKLFYSDTELVSGGFYVYLGMHNGEKSTTNWYQMQLEEQNPLYYYDSTRGLVSYETYLNDLNSVTVDASLSDTSVNPVQNRVIKAALDSITISGGGEMNVQSDWDEADITSDAYIQNKPTVYETAFLGSNDAVAGTMGLVPAPPMTSTTKVLTSDRSQSWQNVSNIIPMASQYYLGGIKTGYTATDNNAPILTDSNGNAYASIGLFGGATSSVNGSRGLVPTPLTGEQAKYLRADGVWADVLTDTSALYGCYESNIVPANEQAIGGLGNYSALDEIGRYVGFYDECVYLLDVSYTLHFRNSQDTGTRLWTRFFVTDNEETVLSYEAPMESFIMGNAGLSVTGSAKVLIQGPCPTLEIGTEACSENNGVILTNNSASPQKLTVVISRFSSSVDTNLTVINT